MAAPAQATFDFERLRVFEVALDAVVAIDALTRALPSGRSYIRDQLRRAANSIPLNVAEGAGEFLPTEKARFYRIARRSATECAGQLIVGRRLEIWPAENVDEALVLLRRAIVMLVRLLQVCAERAESKGSSVDSGKAARRHSGNGSAGAVRSAGVVTTVGVEPVGEDGGLRRGEDPLEGSSVGS